MKAEFILGTVQFGLAYGIQNAASGSRVNLATSHALLEQAKGCGIRCLDTANDYGESQKVIGASPLRDGFRLYSKFRTDGGRHSVREAWEKTCAELGVSAIEGYSFHRFDEAKDPAAWKELRALKESGAIRRIGMSVYQNEELEFAVRHPDVDVIQLPYNLLDNWRLRGPWLQRARDQGKILHARSIYLQGLLLMSAATVPTHLREVLPALEKIDRAAQEAGLSRAALCMAYVLSRGVFQGIVIGVDTPEQLAQNHADFVAASRATRDFSVLDELETGQPALLNPGLWPSLARS